MPVASKFSRITRHSSHVTRHTSHITRVLSPVTCHISHATRHTLLMRRRRWYFRGPGHRISLPHCADRPLVRRDESRLIESARARSPQRARAVLRHLLLAFQLRNDWLTERRCADSQVTISTLLLFHHRPRPHLNRPSAISSQTCCKFSSRRPCRPATP
jgi:hypothetical protein